MMKKMEEYSNLEDFFWNEVLPRIACFSMMFPYATIYCSINHISGDLFLYEVTVELPLKRIHLDLVKVCTEAITNVFISSLDDGGLAIKMGWIIGSCGDNR